MAVRILKNSPDSEVREYETLYEGCVLALRERNGYDDSDFVALCWDEAKGEVVEYVYASTRWWSYTNSAVEDADEGLRWAVAERAARRVAARRASVEAEVRGAVKVGATVSVVGGRKYLGREGRVFWAGEKYNAYSHRNEERVGVDDGEMRFFLPASQVRVVVPADSEERIADEVENRLLRELGHELWEAGVGARRDGKGVSAGDVWHLVASAA